MFRIFFEISLVTIIWFEESAKKQNNADCNYRFQSEYIHMVVKKTNLNAFFLSLFLMTYFKLHKNANNKLLDMILGFMN